MVSLFDVFAEQLEHWECGLMAIVFAGATVLLVFEFLRQEFLPKKK